jgi:hypothetical protein
VVEKLEKIREVRPAQLRTVVHTKEEVRKTPSENREIFDELQEV